MQKIVFLKQIQELPVQQGHATFFSPWFMVLRFLKVHSAIWIFSWLSSIRRIYQSRLCRTDTQ